jgi:hypothetical protein
LTVLSEDETTAMAARGLMQSAVMCVDVLAKALGEEALWADTLIEALQELNEGARSVSASLSNASKESEANMDLLKLLGSIYLCCGTICACTGPRSVAFLSVRLSPLLISYCRFLTMHF